MKRGQLTIFVIVGIVLLFILGFAIYIAGKSIPVANIDEVGSENDPSGCLGRVGRHVLLLTAAEDKGFYVKMPFVMLVNYPIPTNINYTAALYDWEYQRYGVAPDSPDRDNVRFGIYNIDPLCLKAGANRPKANGNTSSCMGGTYQQWFEDDEKTIQARIEDRINNSLAEANCSTEGPVTVVFGNNDVTVYTKDTTAIVPMRFKRMHNAAVRIAQEEIRNLVYNLQQPTQIQTCDEPTYSNNCLMPEMEVKVTHEGDRHLVTITDRYQKVNGEFPVYNFYIQNRYPTITSYPNGGYASYTPKQTTIHSYADSRTETIPVTSHDADDERLTVTYEKRWDGDTRPSTREKLDEEDEQPGVLPKLSFDAEETGIYVTGIPACLAGRTYTFREQIYYEACDGQAFCANTTIPAPKIELSTDPNTVENCCALKDAVDVPQYSAYPGDDWCCANKGSVENMVDSDPWKATCCAQTSFTTACCGFYNEADITDPDQREACGFPLLEEE